MLNICQNGVFIMCFACSKNTIYDMMQIPIFALQIHTNSLEIVELRKNVYFI